MQQFYSVPHALRILKKQGVVWLTLADVLPERSGKDIFIWDCTANLDMSEKGRSWKDAILLDSPNGNAILESALESGPSDQIYFNNQQIIKK
jgi:hypothetical protein